MGPVLVKTPQALPRLLNFFPHFAKREDGMVTIFACLMIFCMLMVGGIGVDMMRHEMERTAMQSVSDRAVLAAADLDQDLEPEAVVRDYFAKSGMQDYVQGVTVDSGLSFKTVTVDARTRVNTMFMDYLGVQHLNVGALSTAQERASNVEISLVLDISGSMRFSNRMNELRPAASDFIQTVLSSETGQFTSINLVPYAGQTNPGPFMFNRLNGQRYPTIPLDESAGGIPEAQSHGNLPAGEEGGVGSDPNTRYVYPNVSSCLDVNPTGFSDTQLPAGALYPQTPHFMNWNIAWNVMEWGWCPQDDQSIQYMSNDVNHLTNFINTMRMNDGTGTHYAMKWAVAMLDPSSRDDVTALANAGLASPDFIGRPADYNDPETAKYIVLMTDGQITQQVRPSDTMDLENPTRELGRGRGGDRRNITSASTNVASFFEQCNLAKSRQPQPIIVFTIAFDAPGTPERQMRECASSEAHFYTADTNNIGDVFDSIARQISKLRLTQ